MNQDIAQYDTITRERRWAGLAPHWPLVLLAVVAPSVPILTQRGLVAVMAVLSLAAIAAHLLGGRPFQALRPWPIHAAAGLGVLWSAATAAWALDASLALKQSAQFAGALLAFALTMPVVRSLAPGAARALIAALSVGLVLAVMLLAVDTWGDWAVQKLVLGVAELRITHLDNKALVTAALLAWPAGLGLARRWGAAAGVAVIAVVAAAVFPGASGTAAMALLAGAAGASAALAPRRLVLFILGAALVTGALAQPWLAQLAVDQGLSTAPEIPVSWRHRLFIWSFSADLIAQQPVLGWGTEAARIMPNFGIDNPFEPGKAIIPLHTHNALIQVWLEQGIIGLALLLALLLAALAAAVQLDGHGRVFAVGGWTTTIAAGLAGYGSGQSWWLFTIVLQALLFTAATRCPVSPPARP